MFLPEINEAPGAEQETFPQRYPEMLRQLPLLESFRRGLGKRGWDSGWWRRFFWPFMAYLPCPNKRFPPLSAQSLLSRFVDGLTFKVNFTFNRQPLRVQHRALELTGRWLLWPMLFPVAPRDIPLLPSDVKLK